MRRSTACLAAMFALACQPEPPPPPADTPPPGPAMGTPEWKIQNAMSAAPEAVARNATIMDWPAAEGGTPTQLRAGTNEWTCFPDMADTPGNDPMCLDKVWLGWVAAWQAKKPYTTKTVGVAYMLQGGSAASNTDPYKMTPDEGQPWLVDGPHLMWISPDPKALDNLPSTPGGAPYVMWKGTPYAHVMIPAK